MPNKDVYCSCNYPSKLEDLSPELQKQWAHLKGCCVRCMHKIRPKEDYWFQQRIDAYKED